MTGPARYCIPVAFLVLALAARPARADNALCEEEAAAVAKVKRDPSLAPPKSAKAKEHLETAKRAYGVGKYEVALDEYASAGLLDEAPLILWDLGQTYRAMKEYEKAIRQYELFLDRGKPGEKLRALIECYVTAMQAELDHAASTAPPQGPETNDNATAPADTDGAAVSEAPPHDDLESGRRASPSRWTGMRKVALGLAVVGLGGVATGVIFGVQAQGLNDDAARLCPSSPCANADEANALTDRADVRSTLANVSYGLGGAMIAGAVVLWFVGAPSADGEEDSGAALIPQVSPTFTGVAFSGRF